MFFDKVQVFKFVFVKLCCTEYLNSEIQEMQGLLMLVGLSHGECNHAFSFRILVSFWPMGRGPFLQISSDMLPQGYSCFCVGPMIYTYYKTFPWMINALWPLNERSWKKTTHGLIWVILMNFHHTCSLWQTLFTRSQNPPLYTIEALLHSQKNQRNYNF